MTTPELTEPMAETEAVSPIDPTLTAVMTMFSQMQGNGWNEEKQKGNKEKQKGNEEKQKGNEEKQKGRDMLSKRERKSGGDMNYYSLPQDQYQQQIPSRKYQSLVK